MLVVIAVLDDMDFEAATHADVVGAACAKKDGGDSN